MMTTIENLWKRGERGGAIPPDNAKLDPADAIRAAESRGFARAITELAHARTVEGAWSVKWLRDRWRELYDTPERAGRWSVSERSERKGWHCGAEPCDWSPPERSITPGPDDVADAESGKLA